MPVEVNVNRMLQTQAIFCSTRDPQRHLIIYLRFAAIEANGFPRAVVHHGQKRVDFAHSRSHPLNQHCQITTSRSADVGRYAVKIVPELHALNSIQTARVQNVGTNH